MRMRVIGWQVQPLVMQDDGEDLVSVEVNSVFIPAREWEAFKNGGDQQALEPIRKQVEGD